METNSPIWQMKISCPCCGQGSPSFVICPGCNYLTVHCDEMLNTFIDPRKLDSGFAHVCPSCKQVKAEDFLTANSDQIIKAGFTKDEYE